MEVEVIENVVVCPVCKVSHIAFKETGKDVLATTCQNCGHFFKFRVTAPFKASVSFTVNGKAVTVGNDWSPSTSLNDYLRNTKLSTGTKVFCKQGGCGVCIVVAKMHLNPQSKPVTANINSCLCPLFACDGWAITTIEGIGSTQSGMHEIQTAVAGYNGTQCGYCTPGHIMNMYGLTKKYPNLTKQMVEDHFEGNLCRCTGYRPILDAMKSLVPAQAKDIEDIKLCKKTGKPCDSKDDPDKPSCSGQCSKPKAIHMVFGDARWVKPTTVAELQTAISGAAGQKIRIMGANTGTGYFPQESLDNYAVAIDISGIPDMYVNTFDGTTYTIGACLTLSDLLDIFEAKAASNDSFNELKKYLYRVASSPIRNRGTWAGNLMLKNKYHSFPSDVFNIFTVLKATLYIGPNESDGVSVEDFWNTDMTGKVLYKATFKDLGQHKKVACFKVMPRSQNSLALVNGAFRLTVDDSYNVTGEAVLSIGGISDTFHRAAKTEAYLVGKRLSDASVVSGAISTLSGEVVPASGAIHPSATYRKTVACAIFYKFILKILGNDAGSYYRSAPDVLHDVRPLSSGEQSYDTNRQEWPLNEPVKKLEADVQCTGEALYCDDIVNEPDQLFGAFVTATVGNATIQTINTSEAMNVPGVVRVLTASDIHGRNDVSPPTVFNGEAEELFSSGKVSYYGQSVAFVVADSQAAADKAAKLVHVTYNSQSKAVVHIDDAIAARSFFPSSARDTVKGNPDQAISSAPHTLSGQFHCPEQIHFCFETQATNARPDEDGMRIVTTTQWIDSIQECVARVTGMQKSRIFVRVKRLGGGYGGKISRNNIVAAACGLACRTLNKPVRARLDIQTQLEMLGRRFQRRADYRIGFDNNGKLLGIEIKMYEGEGYIPNDNNLFSYYGFADSGYFCDNWRLTGDAVKLNTAMATYCRAPSSAPAVLVMEHIMEVIATALNKDATEVKQLNFYKDGETTPSGETLQYVNIKAVTDQLMSSAEVQTRQASFKYFNQDNRWKKKALSVVPMKFGLSYNQDNFTDIVSIYYEDGSVSVTHGGVEMGQGINTKVAQVVAYELGVPLSLVSVKATNSIDCPNNFTTGGSITSESCAAGAIEICRTLNERLAPYKRQMPSGYSWADLIRRCHQENVVLTETYTDAGNPFSFGGGSGGSYNSYGATCAEVELDVLTGEYQINRVDMVYDCGESLNPAVDIGQCEGAFVMGLGLNTTEEVVYDDSTGQMISFDTWGYLPPTNKDIPIDFRVALLKNAPNPKGVLRSKASGEPPLTMACAVFFALRNCVMEARKDAGQTGDFTFEPPATVENVQSACLTATSQFAIK